MHSCSTTAPAARENQQLCYLFGVVVPVAGFILKGEIVANLEGETRPIVLVTPLKADFLRGEEQRGLLCQGRCTCVCERNAE